MLPEKVAFFRQLGLAIFLIANVVKIKFYSFFFLFFPSSIHCLNSKCKCLKINEIKPYLLSLFLAQVIGYKQVSWHCMHCERGGKDTARKNRKANNGGKK